MLVIMTQRKLDRIKQSEYRRGHDDGVERGYGSRMIAREAESHNKGCILSQWSKGMDKIWEVK